MTLSPKLPGKASSTVSAKRVSQRLVIPATAFCSCTTSGRRCIPAATPPGPVTKPPIPTTQSGLIRRNSVQASPRARIRRNGASSRASFPCPAGRNMNGGQRNIGVTHQPLFHAATGAEPVTSWPRSCSARAVARAGNTMTPVPPAIIRKRRGSVIHSPSRTLLVFPVRTYEPSAVPFQPVPAPRSPRR